LRERRLATAVISVEVRDEFVDHAFAKLNTARRMEEHRFMERIRYNFIRLFVIYKVSHYFILNSQVSGKRRDVEENFTKVIWSKGGQVIVK